MDSVERLRLVEDGRLWTVEVLRLLLRIEFAPTEGDWTSEVVANWEDETIAEEIDKPAARSCRTNDARLHEGIERWVVRSRVLDRATNAVRQRVELGRRRSEAKGFDGDVVVAAARCFGASPRARFGISEDASEEFLGKCIRSQDVVAGWFAVVARPTLRNKRRQFDAGARREETQRLGELHAVVVDDEVDRVASRAARKALVEACATHARLMRDNRHRWRAVIVERAKPDVLASLRSQRHSLANDRQDVGRGEDTVAIRNGAGRLHEGVWRWTRGRVTTSKSLQMIERRCVWPLLMWNEFPLRMNELTSDFETNR